MQRDWLKPRDLFTLEDIQIALLKRNGEELRFYVQVSLRFETETSKQRVSSTQFSLLMISFSGMKL
jgi:hypothetical protein